MNRRTGIIVLTALLTTLCQQLTFAQGMSLSQQLSEMEVIIFNKDFTKNSAVWRIEHLEKNFPAAGKQKKKDLPTRMRDLTEQIQPQSLQPPSNIQSRPRTPAEDASGSHDSDPYSSNPSSVDAYSARHNNKQGNSKNPIGQAVGVPKSLMGGSKRAVDRFKDFEDGAGYVPNTATRAHKFSGADGWSQESNALDWYRPGNLRGFTPHYVDGSESNDNNAYSSGRTTMRRRPSYQSQRPPYSPSSQYQQRPPSYADDLDDL